MENRLPLSEFIWEYATLHDYCSRAVIAGKYIDTFGIKLKRGEEKTNQQKSIMRKVASIFSVMKALGIASYYSKKTIRINRVVLNAFSLQDVLTHKKGDCISKKSVLIDII